MIEKRIVSWRYIYTHEIGEGPSQSVDIHQVVAGKKDSWKRVQVVVALLLIAFCVILMEDKSASTLFFYLSLAAFFINLLFRKLVERESVVIIPAFGVQLETHFRSGRAIRNFVPIDKILKPVLNECVTPVTCYWTLTLILRKEEQLTLVFTASRPPLKMLLPVWKALSAATETGKLSEDIMCNVDMQGEILG